VGGGDAAAAPSFSSPEVDVGVVSRKLNETTFSVDEALSEAILLAGDEDDNGEGQ
jgi:hypothetical protein